MNRISFWASVLVLGFAGRLGAVVSNVPTPPGGLNGYIQYNQRGSFAGSSGLTYSTTTLTISVTSMTASGTIIAGFFQGDGSRLTGISAGGGGAASSLEVGRGSLQAFIQVSSPTSHISFATGPFTVTLISPTSAFVSVDYSSFTMLGKIEAGGGSADNFGSHLATQPANFQSIRASSCVFTSSVAVFGVVTSTTGFIGESSTFTYLRVSDQSYLSSTTIRGGVVATGGYLGTGSTFTTVAIVSNGTVNKPSIQIGDADPGDVNRAGMYLSSIDQIAFAAQGSQIMRMDSGNIRPQVILVSDAAGTVGAPSYSFGIDQAAGMVCTNAIPTRCFLTTAGGDRLRWSSDGSVGIGKQGFDSWALSVGSASGIGYGLLNVSSGTSKFQLTGSTGSMAVHFTFSSGTISSSFTVIAGSTLSIGGFSGFTPSTGAIAGQYLGAQPEKGQWLWMTPSGGGGGAGDNLGDGIATTLLQMSGFAIQGSSQILLGRTTGFGLVSVDSTNVTVPVINITTGSSHDFAAVLMRQTTETFTVGSGTSVFKTVIAGSQPITGLSIDGTGVKFSTASNQFGFSVSSNGYVNVASSGTIHTLSSCGAGPVIYGGGSAFTIIPGAAATGCTITFAVPFKTPPIPQVSQRSMSLVNSLGYTITNTALVLTQTSMGTVDVFLAGADNLRP